MKTVVTIITKENKVLIGRLKHEMLEQYGGIEYVFPGGKIEENEDEKAAAIRESLEETGLIVKIIAKIGERIHPKTGRELVYFHAVATGGHLTVDNPKNDDISELVWVNQDELKQYVPTLFEKIELYLNTLNY